jgi:hypothetical protein
VPTSYFREIHFIKGEDSDFDFRQRIQFGQEAAPRKEAGFTSESPSGKQSQRNSITGEILLIEAYNPILQYSGEVKATKHPYCCSRDADTTFLDFWSFHCRPQSGRQASGFAIYSHFHRATKPGWVIAAGIAASILSVYSDAASVSRARVLSYVHDKLLQKQWPGDAPRGKRGDRPLSG